MAEITRKIVVPELSTLTEQDYKDFLQNAYQLMSQYPLYFAPSEDVNSIEMAHLLPSVPETLIAIYVGLNDATCNKALVCQFLVRHGHNNVFVFDPDIYPGGSNVPTGTTDAKGLLNGFEPPNDTWNPAWTYVMIADPARTAQSLWQEKGYIDMIAAKFEDFTMISDHNKSRVCTFIAPKAFDHPVNIGRDYLKKARKLGEKMVDQFEIPKGMEGEVDGLVPVILAQGEKLWVATTDFGPCDHAWSNIHPDNESLAVVNENSAVPLNLIIAKPPVDPKYARNLVPAKGSADMTTDWFYRGSDIFRKPLLMGLVKG
ncbi:hypothetical protein ACFL3G_07850 [Planctomycetota bacterium]